jgi:DNA repair protein RecO
VYHVYVTHGFVVGSTPYGEANARIVLFTRELGLLRVQAQAIRELRSKLRYSVQTLAFGTFGLVRGRELWRLTTAEQKTVLDVSESRVLFAKVLVLVERLVHGEEPDPILFIFLEELFQFLKQNSLTEAELSRLELIAVLRVLHHLGYVGEEPLLAELTHNELLSRDLIARMGGKEAGVAALVDRSLRASQL